LLLASLFCLNLCFCWQSSFSGVSLVPDVLIFAVLSAVVASLVLLAYLLLLSSQLLLALLLLLVSLLILMALFSWYL
jgi:hypothetical protein